MTTSIWWIRRDLRLTDNAALHAALEAAGSFKVGSGTKVVAAVSKAGKSVASVRYTLK